MTLLNALLQLTHYKSPFLRTLIPCIGTAYALQAAVALPSILGQTERFYDLSGSLTYISCTALSLYLPTLRARALAASSGSQIPPWPSLIASLTSKGGVSAWNWRQVLLSAAVTIWATRCMNPFNHQSLPYCMLTNFSGVFPLQTHHFGGRQRLALR